jgi:hypothetical protein
MSEQFPVTVAVRRPDGDVEQVRVGTAVRTAEGFSLRLGDLTIGATAEAAPAARPSFGGGAPRSSGGAPTNFPNYGRSKGAPIAGATQQDLDYYANGARRSLADPGKARFHDKERELLAVIEAEMQRQGFGGALPPVPTEGPRWTPPVEDDFGPPPHTDEDIPF